MWQGQLSSLYFRDSSLRTRLRRYASGSVHAIAAFAMVRRRICVPVDDYEWAGQWPCGYGSRLQFSAGRKCNGWKYFGCKTKEKMGDVDAPVSKNAVLVADDEPISQRHGYDVGRHCQIHFPDNLDRFSKRIFFVVFWKEKNRSKMFNKSLSVSSPNCSARDEMVNGTGPLDMVVDWLIGH